MKKWLALITLVVGFNAHAQMLPVPFISNFRTYVQVQLYNSSHLNLNCSGNVTMHTVSGRMDNAFYFDTIASGAMSFKILYLRLPNEEISFTTNTITCQRFN